VTGGAGGPGVAVAITGFSVTYAGGGGGCGSSTGGLGGSGGGGNGESNSSGRTAGAVNTGGGGGGAYNGVGGSTLSNGGSGIVILKFPNIFTLTVGAGLTSTNTTSGGFKIYSFTAGTGTVTFS
jgi:hypothetical protein